jgi:hypothetical protein
MTTIGELLGEKADDIARDSISIGDVHILPLSRTEGITPKNGEATRNKFFIVLGFDADGNIIGGIVINSNVNQHLSTSITDYLMPISKEQLPFLNHNSFVNCSHLVTVKREKFNKSTLRGQIADKELLNLIVATVIESPYSNKQQLIEFGIIKH